MIPTCTYIVHVHVYYYDAAIPYTLSKYVKAITCRKFQARVGILVKHLHVHVHVHVYIYIVRVY